MIDLQTTPANGLSSSTGIDDALAGETQTVTDTLLSDATTAQDIAGQLTTAETLTFPDSPATLDAGQGGETLLAQGGHQQRNESQRTQPLTHSAEADQTFRSGAGLVNSDVLGPIDPRHVQGSFSKFVQVMEAVELSARNGGVPVEGTLTNGLQNQITAMAINYRVAVPPDATLEQKIGIAREVTLSFMYTYEEQSVRLGGVANRVGEFVGRGASAFSTEDTVSNALGVMAGEHFVRSYNVDDLAQLTAVSRGSYSLNFVADRAGRLQPVENDTVTTFGNDDYTPVYRHGHQQSAQARANSDVVQYLDARQAQFAGDFSPESGYGWRFTSQPWNPNN